MKELIKTKYFKWGVTAFCSLSAVVILFMIISRASGLLEAIKAFGGILTPFIIGIIIAYIMRPIFNECQFRTQKLLTQMGKSARFASITGNVVGVFVSMALFLGLLTGLGVAIIPQLIESIAEIIRSMPDTVDRLVAWINGLEFISNDVKTLINDNVLNASGNMQDWIQSKVLPYFGDLAVKISNGLWGALKFLLNFFIGIIVAVYVLLSKRNFSAQAKKLAFAIFRKETANRLITAARFTDRVFNNFVVGNLIDALIIGLITLLVMTIFNWPLALLVAAIVGVTNLIPFFGPFIGGGVGAILILTEEPLSAAYFLIYVLIIQQIDGNIIKPKVLGSVTDLSSFWVLFSIIAGGGLFGLWGVLLGVPIFTLVYAFIQWIIDGRLEKKGLPEGTDQYLDVDIFDEEAQNFSRLPEDHTLNRSMEVTKKLFRKKDNTK